jgi:hypothetical protein
MQTERGKCPECGSVKIKFIDYMGLKCIKCSNCGLDEAKKYEVYPEEKKSQKEKGNYSPYKKGGSFRTKKP